MLEKIGQLMFIGIEGPELLEKEADFIIRNDIGGVILFARNIQNPKQVFELTQSIQRLSKKTKSRAPLFIGTDNEGGRVMRLKDGFTPWPALSLLGKLDSTSLAFKYSQSMGEEMLAVGINLNFAPCVDILTNPQNQVIGDRSLHSDPEEVAKLASALVRGYIKSGIIPCAKHFPGHGNTLLDSHEELPKEQTDYKTLQQRELIPFKKVFRSRLDVVMTSHILFEKIDSQWPVTLSEKFIKDILRGEYRFKGVVVTDDLGMKALTKYHSPEDIPVKAISAGVDLLLYCNEFDKPPIALASLSKAVKDGAISSHRLDESFQRVMALKKEFLQPFKEQNWSDIEPLMKVSEHRELADAVKAGRVPASLINT